MAISLRTDRGVLAKPRFTNSGAMTIEGHAARAHLTLTDGLDYGDHIERRSLDEVRAIVKQLIGAPLTWNHPTSFFRENPNAATRIGVVTDAWLDGEHAAFRATITDDTAKRMIRSAAQVEISLGYETLVVDGWQTRISVDHVAVVERGRCGNTCRIATDHAHTKGNIMDPELMAAAQSLGVKIDNLDTLGAAHAVMRAAGVNPQGPRASDRGERIDEMPLAYQVARAVSAATYATRDQVDRARADSFATAKRTDAPACGCSGGKLNPPIAITNADAISTERAARERMMQAGRLAHASPERIDEVKTLDAYDQKRTTTIANTRPAPSRADAGDAEARAKAALRDYSANAWRKQSANTDEIDEER